MIPFEWPTFRPPANAIGSESRPATTYPANNPDFIHRAFDRRQNGVIRYDFDNLPGLFGNEAGAFDNRTMSVVKKENPPIIGGSIVKIDKNPIPIRERREHRIPLDRKDDHPAWRYSKVIAHQFGWDAPFELNGMTGRNPFCFQLDNVPNRAVTGTGARVDFRHYSAKPRNTCCFFGIADGETFTRVVVRAIEGNNHRFLTGREFVSTPKSEPFWIEAKNSRDGYDDL